MSEKCKDYGGLTPEGKPCNKDAAWGVDGEEEGPCKHHRYDDGWAEEAKRTKPIDLIKRLQQGVVEPEKVSVGQRRACLPVLCYDKGQTYEEVASIFDVTKGQISQDWDAIENNMEEKVVKVSQSELAVEVFQSMKRDATKLRKQGKYEAANRVISRAIQDLQDLGLIDKQADKMQLNWVDELEDI